MTTKHLLFKVGEHALAAPAVVVQAVHDALEVRKVAGTKSWFKGLAVADGKLLPVTDLGEYLGQRSASGHTIELTESVGIAGLQVDDVFGLSDTKVERQEIDSHATAESSGAILSTKVMTPWIIRDAERVHRVIDISAMLVRPDFIDIAEASSA